MKKILLILLALVSFGFSVDCPPSKQGVCFKEVKYEYSIEYYIINFSKKPVTFICYVKDTANLPDEQKNWGYEEFVKEYTLEPFQTELLFTAYSETKTGYDGSTYRVFPKHYVWCFRD